MIQDGRQEIILLRFEITEQHFRVSRSPGFFDTVRSQGKGTFQPKTNKARILDPCSIRNMLHHFFGMFWVNNLDTDFVSICTFVLIVKRQTRPHNTAVTIHFSKIV